MKSTRANKHDYIKYPCLRIYKDSKVVLFSADRTGTVIYTHNDVNDVVGNHSTRWIMLDFAPFHDTISLTND